MHNSFWIKGVFALAKYQFLLRYRNAMLGYLWAVGDQLLFLIVMAFVFSALNRLPMGVYSLYVFSGLIPWRFLDEAAQGGMESVVSGSWLLTQMPAHPVMFPVVQVLMSLGDFLCAFLAGAIIFFFVGYTPSLVIFILPLSLGIWAVCALGLACIYSAVYVFFRDIKPIIRSGMMLLFFSSAILNMESSFSEGSLQWTFLQWHPLTPLVHLFQKPIFYKVFPNQADWILSIAISLSCLIFGLVLLHACRRKIYFYL